MRVKQGVRCCGRELTQHGCRHRLLDILNNDGYPTPIIVFVNQKKTADMVARDLQKAGWNAATLHSGKSQEGREAALASLRSGEADILVATDLAGRGIDVPDVGLVVNFQMSNTIEAYVHRIGTHRGLSPCGRTRANDDLQDARAERARKELPSRS